MLKGQFELDMEFPMATMLAMLTIILLIGVVVLPSFNLVQNVYGSEGDIKSVEFSNFVKFKLENNLGDGDGLKYDKITSFTEGELSSFGLADNYVTIKNLASGELWEYGKEERRNQHTVYTTIEKKYNIIDDEKEVVMKGDSEYLVHVYAIDKSTVIDVYSDYICDQKGRKEGFPGRYVMIGCSEMEESAGENMGTHHLLGSVISPVVNQAKPYLIQRLVPGSDMTAGDIVPRGSSLGDIEDCENHRRGKVCIRVIGNHVDPASIFVALKNNAEFTSYARMVDSNV